MSAESPQKAVTLQDQQQEEADRSGRFPSGLQQSLKLEGAFLRQQAKHSFAGLLH